MTLDNTHITQYDYWGAEEMGNKLKALVLAWAVLLPAIFMVAFVGSSVQGAAIPTPVVSGWYTGTIDSSTNVVNYDSIAVDSKGFVHISYQDASNLDLKYATNTGGSWSATTIDSAGATGFFNSIAVDGKGFAHISYYDSTDENLKYATNSGGSWVNSTIDRAGVVGEYSTIAVDSNGKVHIAYYDYTNRALKYATNAGGIWTNITIDTTTNAGYTFIHIALDRNNKVHIGYYDSEGSKIKYASNVLGNWANETVVAGDASQFFSIATDSLSRPYIAYLGGISGQLKVVMNNGSGWSFLAIDALTSIIDQVCLAIDSNDKLHIAYYDNINKDLRYATNDSGIWVLDTVDSYNNVGVWASIAVDLNNKVSISYVDSTHNRLKIATNAGARWNIQTADNGPGAGVWNDIAVDGNGVVHIVYYNLTAGKLMHAFKASERLGWQTEIIDNAMNVGQRASIAVDQHNKVHVVYYDSNAQSLKYADNVNGVWANVTVDGSSNVGLWNAIAVDSSDKAHVAYVDSTGHTLKYANNMISGFTTSFIDTSGFVKNAGVSIALDRMGIPHVGYILTNITDQLVQRSLNGTVWDKTVIDGSADVLGFWNSMAIDSHNRVHISYYDQTIEALKYATNATGSWVSSVIDQDGTVGNRSVLALDLDNGLHILYSDSTANKENYLVNTQGVWMKTTIRDPDDATFGSFALDSFGRVHVSYFDATTNSLKYAVSISLPSAPTSFAAQRGNAQVNLTWQLPTNNGGATITGYKIFRGNHADNMTLLTTVIAGTYSLLDSDVANGVTYWYAVSAVSNEGIGIKTGAISAMPATLPNAPISVQAKGVNNAVELSWSAPSDGGSAIVAYRILRGMDSSNLTFLVNASASATGFKDTGLENGKTYFYAVSAVNDIGPGPSASIVSATPLADDTTLIIIGTIAVVAIIGVAIVLMMRRKK